MIPWASVLVGPLLKMKTVENHQFQTTKYFNKNSTNCFIWQYLANKNFLNNIFINNGKLKLMTTSIRIFEFYQNCIFYGGDLIIFSLLKFKCHSILLVLFTSSTHWTYVMLEFGIGVERQPSVIIMFKFIITIISPPGKVVAG